MQLELMGILRVGKDNAITAAALSEALNLEGGVTSESLRLNLVKPLIEEHHIPIGSCSRGYYIIATEEEFNEVMEDLTHRIRGMQNRKRGLRRGWNLHRGERPTLEDQERTP